MLVGDVKQQQASYITHTQHYPPTLQHWQEDEDKGSIASVMSENVLLIVSSMDSSHTNPMYVCEPLCVCVCVYCTSSLLTGRKAFQEEEGGKKCSSRNDRLGTACSPLYSQPALLSNPLSNVKWIMTWTSLCITQTHTRTQKEANKYPRK